MRQGLELLLRCPFPQYKNDSSVLVLGWILLGGTVVAGTKRLETVDLSLVAATADTLLKALFHDQQNQVSCTLIKETLNKADCLLHS